MEMRWSTTRRRTKMMEKRRKREIGTTRRLEG
jgi:hypothetical protein